MTGPEPTQPKEEATLPGNELPLRSNEQIQGNILAGFLKDHRTLLFLQFLDANRGRAWLGELTPRIVRTKEVAAFNERFSKARKERGGDDPENLKALWVNVGLTYQGLITLAPNLKDDLNNFPTSSEDDPERRGFPAFVTGPARRAEELGDTGADDPKGWVVGGLDREGNEKQPVHAVLTVDADDQDDLRVELEKQRARATKYGLVTVFEQRGDALTGELAGHEHFGFKDGISQPGVRGFDPADRPDQVLGHLGSDLIAAGEFVLGHSRQSKKGGSEGDTKPRPCPAWMKDGSFQVFRRLAQDVPSFWARVIANAHSADVGSDLLAAKLVGRWRSGTPLDLAPDEDRRYTRDPEDDNSFEFINRTANGKPVLDEKGDPVKDPEGYRCPRFAHIRKMYPRDNKTFGDERRRILRRGITFGLPFDPAAGRGHGVDAERGLLFMAFMSDIDEQFELLQRSWANDSNHPEPGTGPDPVIGSDPAPVAFRRKGKQDQPLTFPRFVRTTGAVYAFAPSLDTLRELAEGRVQPDNSSKPRPERKLMEQNQRRKLMEQNQMNEVRLEALIGLTILVINDDRFRSEAREDLEGALWTYGFALSPQEMQDLVQFQQRVANMTDEEVVMVLTRRLEMITQAQQSGMAAQHDYLRW